MKNLFKIVIVSLTVTSCAPSVYYQVYKADYDGIKKTNEKLVYEDNNCLISYYLWQEYGNSGFLFTNKTDRDISLNLKECFFIENGLSYDYFQNRIFSDMTSAGSSSTLGTQQTNATTLSKKVIGEGILNTVISKSASLSTTNSVLAGITTAVQKSISISYQEKDIIIVPAKTSRLIQEFQINDVRIRHCDLLLYPENNDMSKVTFTKENSPIVFSNRITYCFNDDCQEQFHIVNEFWISEVSNLPKKKMITEEYEVRCGEKTQTKITYFRDPSPDKFFIRYLGEFYF